MVNQILPRQNRGIHVVNHNPIIRKLRIPIVHHHNRRREIPDRWRVFSCQLRTEKNVGAAPVLLQFLQLVLKRRRLHIKMRKRHIQPAKPCLLLHACDHLGKERRVLDDEPLFLYDDKLDTVDSLFPVIAQFLCCEQNLLCCFRVHAFPVIERVRNGRGRETCHFTDFSDADLQTCGLLSEYACPWQACLHLSHSMTSLIILHQIQLV